MTVQKETGSYGMNINTEMQMCCSDRSKSRKLSSLSSNGKSVSCSLKEFNWLFIKTKATFITVLLPTMLLPVHNNEVFHEMLPSDRNKLKGLRYAFRRSITSYTDVKVTQN